MRHVTAREHDVLTRGPGEEGGTLPAAAFDALLGLLSQEELNPVAVPVIRAGRVAVKLTQWVGVLQMPDGTVLEILPKTHERGGDEQVSRRLLVRMLSAVDARFRTGPPSDLDPADMPLLEVILRYALEGFRTGIRRGVPHQYRTVQEERPVLRGRLDLPRQVRQPAQRAHLVHVVYDEFLPDRPENRLVRLSVERIARLTSRQDTRRLARELLHVLDGIPPSVDVRRDERAWALERGYSHYEPLRGLCRLILQELSPVTRGASTSLAVLFDMNVLYEAYVAHLLRVQYPAWTVRTQTRGRRLATLHGQGVFPVRPDLHLTTGEGRVIVADTKWKRLDPDEAPTYGVVNADAYQLLAYSEVFGAKDVALVYPAVTGLPEMAGPFRLPNGADLHLATVALEGPDLVHVPPAWRGPPAFDAELCEICGNCGLDCRTTMTSVCSRGVPR